jgi:hypothetical protein
LMVYPGCLGFRMACTSHVSILILLYALRKSGPRAKIFSLWADESYLQEK